MYGVFSRTVMFPVNAVVFLLCSSIFHCNNLYFLHFSTVVVVIAFILCWLPFHVGRYLSSKSSEANSPIISQLSEYCSLVSFVLFYLSAAINPILYNIMSKKYRVAAYKLFRMKHSERSASATIKTENMTVWGESNGSTCVS